MQHNKAVTRRRFLQAGAATALGAAALAPNAQAGVARKKVGSLAEIKPWRPVTFGYPDGEPAILLDVGKKVPGGVGPNDSIIAFSALCQHMGCPVAFDAKAKALKCPCHASMFDPVRDGMAFEGPATRGLPRIALHVESGGDVYAAGVATGLVYGRSCNR